jgi:sulfate permease, SulP family
MNSTITRTEWTKIARTIEQNTTLTLAEDEVRQDELEIPDELKQRLLIKHVDGPLFFGFMLFAELRSERGMEKCWCCGWSA